MDATYTWPTVPKSFRFGHYRWMFLTDATGATVSVYQSRVLGRVAFQRGKDGVLTRREGADVQTTGDVVDPGTQKPFPIRWHVKAGDWELDLTRQGIFAWMGEDENGTPVPYSLMVVSGKGTLSGKPVEVGGCAEYFED
jgi:hypothetical protein